MINCINSNSLQGARGISGLVGQARKSGFDHLELSLEPSGPLGQAPWDDLLKEIRNSNMKIASLTSTQFDLFTLAGCHGEPERNAARDTVTQYLSYASSGDFDTMVRISAHETHPPDQVTIHEYETAFNSLFLAIADLTAAAEERAIPLVIENPAAGVLLSPLELRDFIDQVNSPYLGLCLNPTHAARIGNPLDWLHVLDHRILAVHLKRTSASNNEENGLQNDLWANIENQNRNITMINTAL